MNKFVFFFSFGYALPDLVDVGQLFKLISSFLLLFLQFISTIQVRIFYKKIKNINPGQYIVL